ncbi:MAG TPA: hypothetical protein VHE78_05185 [Gemmatimonadaceae bacterium]|nr:hypothetical protein [Gemmatimonadaceae bacterium]
MESPFIVFIVSLAGRACAWAVPDATPASASSTAAQNLYVYIVVSK